MDSAPATNTVTTPTRDTTVMAGTMTTRTTTPTASGPTVVELSIVVLNVIAISDVDESFTVDFAVSMKWRDERLAWGGQSEVLTRTYALEDAWDPTMIITNERNLRAEFPEELEVAPDGAVQYLQRFRGELSATLDLHDFPSDTQRLPIRLAFIGYSPEELRLEFNQEESALLETAGLSGWAISLAGSSVDLLTPAVVSLVHLEALSHKPPEGYPSKHDHHEQPDKDQQHGDHYSPLVFSHGVPSSLTPGASSRCSLMRARSRQAAGEY